MRVWTAHVRADVPLAALALLVALATLSGCGGRPDSGSLAPTDSATVAVGGYRFRSTSNLLTHPWFPATPTTKPWLFKGWGDFSAVSLTRSFSNGGLVAGIKTLKMTCTWSGPWAWKEAWWLAQDTQGNVHALQMQVLQNEKGQRERAQPIGLAAGASAAFMLPRPANTTLGRTWFWRMPAGVKVLSFRITSLSASFRGRSALLRVQQVLDVNGDGVLNPSWSGPDDRSDVYYARKVGLYGSTEGQNPARGYVRK